MKDVFISIRRTPYQSLAAFFVLFFSLFLSIIILFSISFVYGLLGYVETRPQVTVYFQPQSQEGDVFKLRDQLISSGKILSVKYISKTDAFKIYKELNKDNPLLLEMVSADILPPSLEIYAKKPVYLPQIAEFLKKQPEVDEVEFQKIIIDRLLTITNIIRKTSFIFFGFIVIYTILVLSLITHFKVALKKDEINLLQLLGATNLYIKKPFILEGFIFGLLSSICAYLLFLLILLYFRPFLNSYLRGIESLSLNFDFYRFGLWPLNIYFLGAVFLVIAIFGSLISTVSSLVASGKYIK